MRGLLAILAIHAGTCVQRDWLIEQLDPSDGNGDPVNALHANMARLRKLLGRIVGQKMIETVDSGYRLTIDRRQVDACLFIDHIERALHMRTGTPLIVAAMLEDALKLWRDNPFRDTHEGTYLEATAEDLQRLRASARQELIFAWLHIGRVQQVPLYARRFLKDDPLNERLYSGLIIALRMLGRHAEATECYRTAEAVLRVELGVAPGTMLKDALGIGGHGDFDISSPVHDTSGHAHQPAGTNATYSHRLWQWAM